MPPPHPRLEGETPVTRPTRKQLADACDVLTDLRIAECQTGETPPVPSEFVALATEYLAFVLSDASDGLVPHVGFLERLYRTAFRPALGRRFAPPDRLPPPPVDPAFRHRDML